MTVRPALHGSIQGIRNSGNIAVDGVANTDPPTGSTTMTIAGVAQVLRTPVAVGNMHLFSHSDSAAQGGWRLLRITGAYRFNVSDAGGTGRTASPPYDSPNPETLVFVASYVGGAVRCRVNGVLNEDLGPYVGFMAPSAGRFLCFGHRAPLYDQGGEPFGISAFLGSDTVGSDAAALAAIEASLQADLINGRDLRASLPAAFGGAADLVYYDAEDAEPGVPWNSRTATGVAMTPNLQLTKSCYPVVF